MDEKEVEIQNEEEKDIDIEIIEGDGKNLNISPVYNHVKIDKPDVNREKNKKIIIPKSKK